MSTSTVPDKQWNRVLAMMPGDLEQSAQAHLALQRRREIQSAGDLLRLCLTYGFCDLSLRESATWLKSLGLADMSNVAVLERLEKSADWLAHLIVAFMQARELCVPTRFQVRVVDASVLCKPGSKGTDYRLHVGIDLDTLQMTSVELTGAEGGETFLRHTFAPGEVALADRGYAHHSGVASVLGQDAHVVVRMNWHNFPLVDADDEPFDIIAAPRSLAVGQIAEWPVAFTHNRKRYWMRLIVTRKDEEATEKAQAKVRKEAKGEPNPKSLEAAKYTMVLTDLPETILPPEEALDLYRLRWQVETYFKRFKSILHADKLRAKSERLSRTYIYANILAALIIDELGVDLDFFPR